MSSSKPRLTPFLHPFVDTYCLATVFRHGCLAASPNAMNMADPFVYHGPEDLDREEVPVLFSDLYDPRFREPIDILRMAKFAQGVKS